MSEKINIVSLSSIFDPEIGYEDFYTAKYMAKLGHNVTVLTSDIGSDFQKVFPVGEALHPSGIRILRLPHSVKYGSDFIYTKGFKKTLKSLNPDLVYMHNARQLNYLAVSDLHKKMDFVFLADHHDFFFPGHSMRPLQKSFRNLFAQADYHFFRRFIGKSVFKNADAVFSSTKVCYDHLIDYFKVPKEKIVPLEFAVDKEVFYFDEASRRRIREEYRIVGSEFVLAFTGIFTRRKKIEKIVDMLRAIREQGLIAQVKILMVGYFTDESYRNEIESMLKAEEFESRVIFTGKIKKDDLRFYYSACDAVFWIENNSISILEAMACSCIVFVPNMQLAHYVKDNGKVFEVNDIAGLVGAIRECILKGLEELRRMRDRSLELIELEHSYIRNTERIMETYELCRKKRQSS